MKLVYKFEELDNSKTKEVGGKNSSLGEMFKELSSKGINIPDGFATSAETYWKFVKENEIEDSDIFYMRFAKRHSATNFMFWALLVFLMINITCSIYHIWLLLSL